MTARQVGAVVCLFAAAGYGRVTPPAVLRVRVVDHAQIPKERLRRAVNAARDLFRAAGIDTVWLECADRGFPAADPEVEVNILSPAQENGPASKKALGYALMPEDGNAGASVYVFYQRVQQAARSREAFGDELVATVMVHEICHLFGLEHTPQGIMRAHLDRTPLGQRLFTPDQVKRIRSAVITRGKTGA